MRRVSRAAGRWRAVTDQAERAATRTLGRADRDRRTADQYRADLAAETDRSLQLDPTRWPWRTCGYCGWQSRGRREQ